MSREHIIKYRSALTYGIALAAALFLMKWLEWRFLIVNYLFEVYVGILAVVFTGLGIWLALKLRKPKTVFLTVEKDAIAPGGSFVLNEGELAALGISMRELDVLELIAEGLSNQEIAERLFVSLSTVKTHLSNVFEKLEVRRRTQAVEKARRLSLIP